MPHKTKDCRYNLNNQKAKWCAICEEKSHDTTSCALNMENNPNYHIVYQTIVVDYNQPTKTTIEMTLTIVEVIIMVAKYLAIIEEE